MDPAVAPDLVAVDPPVMVDPAPAGVLLGPRCSLLLPVLLLLPLALLLLGPAPALILLVLLLLPGTPREPLAVACPVALLLLPPACRAAPVELLPPKVGRSCDLAGALRPRAVALVLLLPPAAVALPPPAVALPVPLDPSLLPEPASRQGPVYM